MTEPTDKSFGYLTFSTLIHSAAAVSIILLPQLERMPEGNTSGEVIEFTTAGPMPLGETLVTDPLEGNTQDSLPALEPQAAQLEPADSGDSDAVEVAAAPEPVEVEPAQAEPEAAPEPEPLPAPEPTPAASEPEVVEAPDMKELEPANTADENLQEAMAIAAAEEIAIEKALAEQQKSASQESQDSAKALFNDDNSEVLAAQLAAEKEAEALLEKERQQAEAARKAEESAQAAAVLAAQQEAQRQAEAEAKRRADSEAKQRAEAARVAAEKERKQKEFQERLKREAEAAEKARLAAIANQKAEQAKREALAKQAREDLARLNAGKASQRTLGQSSNQNARTNGAQATNKAMGSPTGQIRDYRDIVQLPGNIPPRYPVNARRNRQQGMVKLVYFVNGDGSVRDVRVMKSSGYQLLDQEAVAAVEKYRYKPGQAGWALHSVSFQLRGEEEAAFGRLRRAGP